MMISANAFINNLQDLKVSEIVSHNIKTAHVFKKYGIDFCCGGSISLQNACNKKNINILLIESDLIQVLTDAHDKQTKNYNDWSIDFLIEYIVNVHHSYILKALPVMVSYAEKVLKVHEKGYPKIREIYHLIIQIKFELESHMSKEEKILFPLIHQMLINKKINDLNPQTSFEIIEKPIEIMIHEHETVGDHFKRISDLSDYYKTPEWACNTFKALYSILEEFEEDLHIHVHLENNILFPKAIKLFNENKLV